MQCPDAPAHFFVDVIGCTHFSRLLNDGMNEREAEKDRPSFSCLFNNANSAGDVISTALVKASHRSEAMPRALSFHPGRSSKL